jgi:hypothetical protein
MIIYIYSKDSNLFFCVYLTYEPFITSAAHPMTTQRGGGGGGAGKKKNKIKIKIFFVMYLIIFSWTQPVSNDKDVLKETCFYNRQQCTIQYVIFKMRM